MTECCYGHDPCPELARYQAALARVRALCDRATAVDARCEWLPLIRAALDGSNR